MLLIILLSVLISIFGKSEGAISLREPVRNGLEASGVQGTLDKVKVIGHPSSGRCLVIENRRRQGETREDQVVLWTCHDPQIKGLEQEMFQLVKSNGGGYLLIGYAGANDKCVTALDGYNDHVVTRKCNPFDGNMSWLMRRVEGSKDAYQIVQMSTGRCIRAPGQHDGAWIRVGDCDLQEEKQMWQICGLNGSCEF